MQSLYFLMLVSSLGQPAPGYSVDRPVDRPGASRAVYEQPQGSSSRNYNGSAASREADLRWQRRDGGFDTARNSGVRAASYGAASYGAASYAEGAPQSAKPPRPVSVRWVSWTLNGAQSPAALLMQQSGLDAEAEELLGVPISLTDVLSRSGGRSEPVAAYWQLVHRVTTLGARRREFQDMLAFGKTNELVDEAWQAALMRVEAQYLEAKRDLLTGQDQLRRILGDNELPIPSDPFWTGDYETGLSARKLEEISAEIRVSSQQIELHHNIAQKWATTADLHFRVYGAQGQLDRWMVEFEQWRDARGKAIDATLSYNLAISNFAHQVGKGDSSRLAKMMLPRETNIARGTPAEVPR